MRKTISTIILLFTITNFCYSQFTPPGSPSTMPMGNIPNNNVIIYRITKTIGNEDEIKKAGNIAVTFSYDSIGKNWNLPTENDYLRFKILHFYILNERKEGEHWKKLYYKQKTGLNEKFDDYMNSRLKHKGFKISTKFSNTEYILKVRFYDKATNVQYNDFCAIYEFINSKTGEVVLQYYIEPKNKNKFDDYTDASENHNFLETNKQGFGTFLDMSVAMSNFFKKHLKN